jgi:hypothetical protein
MLYLTRPRTRTTRTLSTNECFMFIRTGFGNQTSNKDDPSCPEEGEVRP